MKADTVRGGGTYKRKAVKTPMLSKVLRENEAFLQ